MSNKLKVGIVGCGYIADQVHIPSFKRLRDKVILQGVCDKNANLAKEVSSKHSIPRVYDDLSKMLQNEDLDIIDICTPPQIHASLAINSIKHGCHVLMEKPMALTTQDCSKMINAADKQGTKICIIHNKLFDPPFIRAKKLVSEGSIGDFIGMRLFLSDHRDEMIMKKDHWIHKLPGGLISETGPHFTYMSLAFLNKIKHVEVYAKNYSDHPWAPFDEFRVELEGEHAMSSITLSYSSNRHNLHVDVLGTDKILHLDLCANLFSEYGALPSVKPIAFTKYFSSIVSQQARGAMMNALNYWTGNLKTGHNTLIEKYVDSIINNTESPVNGEKGRETVKVMEMIVKRLKEKYPERYQK